MAEGFKKFPNGDTGTWIRWLAQVMVIPFIVFVFIQVSALDKRMSVVEANRFTSKNAADLQLVLQQKDAQLLALINDIKRDGAVQEERINVLLRDLDRIQEELEEKE